MSDLIAERRFTLADAGEQALDAAREQLSHSVGPPAERSFPVRLWDRSTEYEDGLSRFRLIPWRPAERVRHDA
jgi:hypothetical protein